MAIAAAIALAAGGCSGQSDERSQPTSARSHVAQSSPPGWYWKNDSDNDADEHMRGPSTDDEATIAAVWHGASATDRRSIEKTVRDYYAAATRNDGIRGCSLLQASIVAQIATEQDQRRQDCSTSLSTLFKRWHTRLAEEGSATMVFTGVHVDRDIGSVTLGFKEAPEAEIIVQREGDMWKLAALFDSGLP